MTLVRDRFLLQNHIEQRDGYMAYPSPYLESPSPYVGTPLKETAPSPPSPPAASPPPSGTRISPAVLFIIVILAVLFFISGLLHLLVRFLIKNPSSSSSYRANRFPEMSTTDALQRQLQQLFHLHDSGLDQAFIDALPVFQYKDVVGQKEPFDCAVCLCEFSEKDKLRLLPMCSHAFHINCIDTWLLSNSTCPLCRGTLFTPGLPIENPMFDFDDLREEDGYHGNRESGLTPNNKSAGVEEIVIEKGALPVRLGKFRRVNGAAGEEVGGETSSSNLDARRCYSMGSYQYVLGETELRVPLSHDRHGHGAKISQPTEANGDSSVQSDVEGKNINSVAKGESYSVSKIWLWPRKGKFAGTSNEQPGMPSSLQSDLPWMGRSD